VFQLFALKEAYLNPLPLPPHDFIESWSENLVTHDMT
jgi:hypothetical protein